MTSMNIEDILIKPGEYNSAEGRYLEKLKLYEDGIRELLQDVQNESNINLKNHYNERIKELLSKVERIKNEIQNKNREDVVESMYITEGATGYSYEYIFGNYLTDDVKKIDMQDPYLKEHNQIRNLAKFMGLVVQKCKNLKEIIITTQPDSTPFGEQRKYFENLTDELACRNISLNIKYSERIHCGQIIFDNGYIFKSGRGLDIYKDKYEDLRLGFNFNYRECKETMIDFFKTS